MAKERCTCTSCKNTFDKAIMIRVEKNNRGGRGSYLCRDCNRIIYGYTTENNEWRGADPKHPNTFGLEFETTYSNTKARSELFEYGMLPTYDSTVDVEYKSCIERNLKSFSHLFKVCDKLIANGDLEVGDTAGTHFHVGHNNLNWETIGYIRRFYHSLFIPLSDAMKANPEKTAELFGRGIDQCNSQGNCWAQSVHEWTSATNHTNFINVQHDNTLEFRMAKFQNSKQYMRMAKFATKCTNIVMTNFVEHFNDEIKDTKRYPTKKAYRKHKADMTAGKLVKAFMDEINR